MVPSSAGGASINGIALDLTMVQRAVRADADGDTATARPASAERARTARVAPPAKEDTKPIMMGVGERETDKGHGQRGKAGTEQVGRGGGPGWGDNDEESDVTLGAMRRMCHGAGGGTWRIRRACDRPNQECGLQRARGCCRRWRQVSCLPIPPTPPA